MDKVKLYIFVFIINYWKRSTVIFVIGVITSAIEHEVNLRVKTTTNLIVYDSIAEVYRQNYVTETVNLDCIKTS